MIADLIDEYLETAKELVQLQGRMIADGVGGRDKFDQEFYQRFMILSRQFQECRVAVEALREKEKNG